MSEKEVLFTPIKIGNRVAPNRMAINAMECCDSDEEGNPTEKTYQRYRKLFEGKAGLVDLEAITVSYENRSRKTQLSIMPRNKEALTKFVREMKSVNKDTIFIFQLTHSGELSHPDFSKRVCVKPLPGFGGELLSEEDIEWIMDEFVLAAKICHDAGADGVDLKLSHGYLGSQLLRPYNDRKWKYGGSWENRSRFAFELTERVVREVNDPNFIIGSKVSVWEGFPGGCGSAGPDTAVMDLTESIALCKGLEERGSHYILQSAGSPSITLALSQPDRKIPDYAYLHHYFSKVLKENLKPETVVIGSAYSIFRDGKNAFQAVDREKNTFRYWSNKNITDGYVDMAALGRQSFADPYLPAKLMEGKENEIKWCTACDNCIELLIRQMNVGCCVYNRPYTEALQKVRKEEGLLREKHT
ncbi:2,4-dienoyl-CoA reductase [Mesotoga sp.]|uniref:oxidoreductase n=1 Tax=Mesotoga sp. TaxID=2053577 RepID=UPI00345F0144